MCGHGDVYRQAGDAMTQKTEAQRVAVGVARNLRIKIHDMSEHNPYPACRASNGANAKWLDRVSLDDAPIVEAGIREFAEAVAEKIKAQSKQDGVFQYGMRKAADLLLREAGVNAKGETGEEG